MNSVNLIANSKEPQVCGYKFFRRGFPLPQPDLARLEKLSALLLLLVDEFFFQPNFHWRFKPSRVPAVCAGLSSTSLLHVDSKLCPLSLRLFKPKSLVYPDQGKGWQSSWAPSLDRLSTSFTSLAQGLVLFSSSSAMHKKYADYFIPHVSRCFIVFPQNYQIFHLAIKECPSHFFFLVLVFSLNFSWAPALFCQWNQRSDVHWAHPRGHTGDTQWKLVQWGENSQSSQEGLGNGHENGAASVSGISGAHKTWVDNTGSGPSGRAGPTSAGIKGLMGKWWW